jgi:ApeA N-terminal domain 1
VHGEFWVDIAQHDRLSGRYDVDRGLLTVHGGELVHCMEAVDRGSYSESYPRIDINRTYLIFGVLSDGMAMTLPYAVRGGCRHTAGSTEQDFHLLYALVGGHVRATERYPACILRFSQPWQSSLANASWCGILDVPGHGSVQLTINDDLRFDNLPLLSQGDIERFLVAPLRALLVLLSGRDVRPELTLHRAVRGPIAVSRPRGTTMEEATVGRLVPVVSLDAIGLSGLNAWYRLSDRLVPVTSLIAKTIVDRGYDIEIKILSLAASAEAINRELYDEKTMSSADARRIRRAAVAAVPEDARERVRRMLQNLRHLTYAERLERLLAKLQEPLSNEIAGSRSNRQDDSEEDPQTRKKGRDLWVQSVKDARNGFAHLSRSSPDDIRRYADRMYVLYESLRWMLTGVLLQHVGVPQQTVFEGFKKSSSYHLFRERSISSWPDIYSPEGDRGA